tara:strand:- start:225 stop:602 length:378 start_codon:yes stop_codon:yes gene_type:complete
VYKLLSASEWRVKAERKGNDITSDTSPNPTESQRNLSLIRLTCLLISPFVILEKNLCRVLGWQDRANKNEKEIERKQKFQIPVGRKDFVTEGHLSGKYFFWVESTCILYFIKFCLNKIVIIAQKS